MAAGANFMSECVMTTTAAKARPVTSAGWLALILAAPGHLVGRLLDELSYRRALSELEKLDDRMLDDIGVSRSDIPRKVRGGHG